MGTAVATPPRVSSPRTRTSTGPPGPGAVTGRARAPPSRRESYTAGPLRPDSVGPTLRGPAGPGPPGNRSTRGRGRRPGRPGRRPRPRVLRLPGGPGPAGPRSVGPTESGRRGPAVYDSLREGGALALPVTAPGPGGPVDVRVRGDDTRGGVATAVPIAAEAGQEPTPGVRRIRIYQG